MKPTWIRVLGCCAFGGLAVSFMIAPNANADPGFHNGNPAYWQGGEWQNDGGGFGGFTGDVQGTLYARCDDPVAQVCNDLDEVEYTFWCSASGGYCEALRERPSRITQYDKGGCDVWLSCPDGTYPVTWASDYETTHDGDSGGDCYAQCASGPATYAEVYVGVSECYDENSPRYGSCG
jgi:hypothetical protein